jgi:hypothetical protein
VNSAHYRPSSRIIISFRSEQLPNKFICPGKCMGSYVQNAAQHGTRRGIIV